MTSAQISRLNAAGQSIWYDNLSRNVLRSGELQSIIEAGVSGLTSNPTIFKKAIADTQDYDADIKQAMAEGLDVEQICERLMVQDVGSAADLLKPVYEASGGEDGYASIEVSPLVAMNTEDTIAAAERLWAALARPNVLVKVPATPQGIPAIRALLEKGINVNITLTFSVEVYKQVLEAYLSAMESRVNSGASVDKIKSVASFFVSRLDAILEKKLAKLPPDSEQAREARDLFSGKLGIANSRKAYYYFRSRIVEERCIKLRNLGARLQRPLWASTGPKSAELDPLHYVWDLAGPDTVNTMPPATLKALLATEPREAGLLKVESAENDRLLSKLDDFGLSLQSMTDELREQGVESFAQSYRDLMAAVRSKCRTV